jgi:phosphoglucosamine mutase
VVDGDVIMALCADNLKRRDKLTNNTLVATIMSNLALDHAMRERGINVIRTKVGDRYVIQSMREGDFALGGEQSGHMIFLKHNTTGDGILAGLQVLAIMMDENKPMSELSNILTPFPQVHKNVKVKQKKELDSIPALAKEIAACKNELGERGRLVLRYSGTENIARVMVEGASQERIQEMATSLAGLIDQHLGTLPGQM